MECAKLHILDSAQFTSPTFPSSGETVYSYDKSHSLQILAYKMANMVRDSTNICTFLYIVELIMTMLRNAGC
jgi:hypothetical protein